MGTLVNITCLLCGYSIKILARVVLVMGRFNPGHGGLCFYPSPAQTLTQNKFRRSWSRVKIGKNEYGVEELYDKPFHVLVPPSLDSVTFGDSWQDIASWLFSPHVAESKSLTRLGRGSGTLFGQMRNNYYCSD